MVQASFSPAVAAGLMDAMTAGLPREAHGALADAVGAYALVLASTDFLMGVAAGVSACGVVAIAVGAVAAHRSRALREEQELASALGNTSAQSVIIVDAEAKAAKADANAAAKAETSVVPAQPQAEVAPASGHRAAAHFAPAAPQDAEAAPTRQAMADRSSAKAHTASVNTTAPVAVSASVEKAPEAGEAKAARHAASDYGDIAQNYVSRLSWRDRMSIRARGVQAMLAERLGVDMFEDVPVIQRADGSVGDVGTGWWDARLGSSVKRDFGNLPEVDDIDMTGVRNVLVARSSASEAAPRHNAAASPKVAVKPSAASAQAERDAEAAATTPAPEKYVSRVAHLNLSAADRAVFITNHVAYVDAEAFPEVHAAEAEDVDLWQLAMDAMESRGSDTAALAGIATAEDPLHMADTPTEVLPFRPVAGHPEVVDKTSYVDYLLRQELERNSSDAVRRTGRDYLHLLEGGSSSAHLFKIPKRDAARHARPARHMAPALEDLPLAVGA